jgi:hypothetical protein
VTTEQEMSETLKSSKSRKKKVVERSEHNGNEIHTPALPCSETWIQQQAWIGSAELITSVHIVKERERERTLHVKQLLRREFELHLSALREVAVGRRRDSDETEEKENKQKKRHKCE